MAIGSRWRYPLACRAPNIAFVNRMMSLCELAEGCDLNGVWFGSPLFAGRNRGGTSLRKSRNASTSYMLHVEGGWPSTFSQNHRSFARWKRYVATVDVFPLRLLDATVASQISMACQLSTTAPKRFCRVVDQTTGFPRNDTAPLKPNEPSLPA